jgi:cation diffusion facilitator CzcD-associated flavoprotein CzcO
LRTTRKPDSSEFPGMTTLSVAVVGSGPAGLYTAEALV